MAASAPTDAPMNVRLLTVVIAAPPDVLCQAIQGRMMECPKSEINISDPLVVDFNRGWTAPPDFRDLALVVLQFQP